MEQLNATVSSRRRFSAMGRSVALVLLPVASTSTLLSMVRVLPSTVVTVAITVTAEPDAPVATDDTYTTPAGVALDVAAPGVLSNDTDADGDVLTAAVAEPPDHGTLVLDSDGAFSYVPDAGFAGTDTFTYVASDGSLGVVAGVTRVLRRVQRR